MIRLHPFESASLMKNVTLGLFAIAAVALGAIYGFVRIRSEMTLGISSNLIRSAGEKHQVTPQMLESSQANNGKTAPPFRAGGSDGRTYERDELIKNGPLVLVFIKESCPCSNEAEPFFRSLHDAVSGRVNFLGVIDGTPFVAKRWIEKHQTPYPILADPEQAIVKAYGVENSAYVALVSPEGTIEHLWPGYSAAMLTELVDRLTAMTGQTLGPIDLTGAPSELYSGCPYF